MTYTGTGTQADPYIPEDFTGFLYCAAQAGCYVKLASDIHAGDDPGYSGEMVAVEIACKEIYADTLTEIEGITVYDESFLTHGEVNAVRTYRNLYFKNCEHLLPATNTVKSFLSAETTSSFKDTFENCLFSMRAVGSGAPKYSFSNNSYHSLIRCAVDFTSTISEMGQEFFCQANVSYSNFIIRNALKQGVRFRSLNRSAVILENFNTSLISIYLATTAVYSYFALVNPSFTGSAPVIKVGTSSDLALLAVQNPTGNYSADDSLTAVTPEQLKSKQYLTEIGFLP